MHKIITALAIAFALITGETAFASEKAEVIAAVNQFIEGYNRVDIKMLTPSCADELSIIDELAPYEWHGKGSCGHWASDYESDARKDRITDGVVTLSKPTHVDIAGDRPSVVDPANCAYKEKGKPVTEVGSIFTVAPHKSADGWQIIGCSWAKDYARAQFPDKVILQRALVSDRISFHC